MATSFKKAPVVEVIAELKWGASSSTSQLLMTGANFSEVTEQDKFFKKFSEAVTGGGYPISERLVPPGFPYPPGFVIYRFKSADSKFLTQVGNGVFSVNALPPYKNWEEFSPQIASSVKHLLASPFPPEEPQNFNSATLRYIDVFKPELLAGLSPNKFITEKLGWKLVLPRALTDVFDNASEIKFGTSLRAISDFEGRKKNIQIKIKEQLLNGEQVVLLDMTISETDSISHDETKVMEIFNTSHALHSQLFLAMTKDIQSLMEPEL